MADDFFTKMQADMKKNFEKFQQDVNSFFGIKPKETKAPETANNQKSTETASAPVVGSAVFAASSTSVQESPVVKASAPANLFTQMDSQWKSFFGQMQSQWNANVAATSSKIKANNEKAKATVDTLNKNMATFFEAEQQKMKASMQQIENDMRQQNAQNRESFFKALSSANENWNKVVANSQKRFEKSVGELNKASWSAQIRIIVTLIPILILVAVIFSLIRPFLA